MPIAGEGFGPYPLGGKQTLVHLAGYVYHGHMTIGDYATARKINDHFQGDLDSQKRSPKGIRRIGSGCYRTAYLDVANKVVYKIGDADSNVNEAAAARALRKRSTRNLGFEVVIPRTRTYRMPNWRNHRGYSYPTYVVAQEFAEGGRYTECRSQDEWVEPRPKCNCKGTVCYARVLDVLKEWSGLSDIHYANVLVDRKERFWIIDLAA